MTPSADKSAAIMADHLRNQEPFAYLRYGDGALESIYGGSAGYGTCDGEPYAPWLAPKLLKAWTEFASAPGVYVGDWGTASFDGPMTHTGPWSMLMFGERPRFLHFEALLLMRESEALVDFYRAVREDPRRKLYMGPERNSGVGEMLNADHLYTPMQDLDQGWVGYTAHVLKESKFDVLLFGAGMAGVLPVVECWKQFPDRTYIHLGSAMDILFRGRSRRQQIPVERARRMFSEMLPAHAHVR